MRRLCALVSVALVLSVTPLPGGQKLSAAEAKDHIGEVATVCGVVVSATYASRTRGQPTFLNLDRPYPNHVFTTLIWGSDRAKFGTPEQAYRDRRICVTGLIESYKGRPEVIARNPGQIEEE